jgi:titin
VISGNNGAGVQVVATTNPLAASGNLIAGNLIGTDATGSAPLGNAEGIILFASGVVVGGTSAPFGNVIAASTQDGIIMAFGVAHGNLIEGNLIGTDVSGSHPLGNAGHGVFIIFGASNNTVGGLAAGAGNVIANSGAAGVAVGLSSSDSSAGNAILSNSIFANAGLGIDLGNNGVTPNTPGGPHTGPNDLQNFPVLSSAVTSGMQTTIAGTLNSTPSTSFTLQFFSNPTSDPSGHGQGQTLLDTITVTTDSNGNASFAATFSPAVAVGQVVTGTATDPSGNTSEFAQDLTVVSGQAPAIAIGTSVRPPVGTNATLAATAQDWGMAALLPTDLDLHDLALDVTLARLRSKASR